jgi:SAM-dependent methyltransferase
MQIGKAYMNWMEKIFSRTRRQPQQDAKEYARRVEGEKDIFRERLVVHDLPPIFHYWSNKHLLPKFQAHNLNGPNDIYFQYASKLCATHSMVRAVSLGSGNADMEVDLALQLRNAGITNFHIECIDIVRDMLNRGIENAVANDVKSYMGFSVGDFNNWRPDQRYDLVIANQCLHHVVELEDLFGQIKKHLHNHGYFLTCDMIGRNGHLRWPEVLTELNLFWSKLPEHQRYNHCLKRLEMEFEDWDCSIGSFEGIRAQDVLPILVKTFNFELFIGWGGLTDIFIDRCFGHNFDPNNEDDLAFIDELNFRQEELLTTGVIKPTQMVAAMTNREVTLQSNSDILIPENSVRLVRKDR